MLVPLWTDVLVWLLVLCALGYALYARGREHLAAPWRRVLTSPAAMSSTVLLLAFLVVGLLDSVHYRPVLDGRQADGKPVLAVEVVSALDWLAHDLRTRTEKTYSAPFATHGYQKETVDRADGKVERIFPRLRHGGAHLQDPDHAPWDIAVRVGAGVLLGLAAWLVVAAMLASVVAWRGARSFRATWDAIWQGRTVACWRAALWALGAVLILAGVCLATAPWYHVLGTDKVGQDVLYQSLKSIRTALVIGTVTTLVTMPLGVLLGIAAGYFKGWVDDVISYVYTTINSIPSVLLIAAAVLMMQVYLETRPDLFPTTAERADLRLLFLCIILGFTSWTGLARLLRGEALKLRELEFIQAAQAFGVSHTRTILRHILPNTMHIVLIALVMEFSALVLAEAVLSYIGVGVDPTMISFGTMINTARLEMGREPMVWWSLASAFGFMIVLVLAANLFADAVRDAFDPRNAMGAHATAGAA